jgi:hypothetical protein
MPQIAQISEIFASQFFWLAIFFGLIYLTVGRGMLPKIEATIDARDAKIAEDLAEAERARARADEIEEANRVEADRIRAEALKVTQAAKDGRRTRAGDAHQGGRRRDSVRIGAPRPASAPLPPPPSRRSKPSPPKRRRTWSAASPVRTCRGKRLRTQ